MALRIEILKRFTDTEKWSDPWYRKLLPVQKLFWNYLCDKCDNSGVWKPDFEMAQFCIGFDLDPPQLSQVFAERVSVLPNGSWFVTKFIPFQFGQLNPRSRVHESIIKLLHTHNIPYPYPINGVPVPPRTGTGTEKDKDNLLEIEFPPGFPKTKDDASTHAAFAGCEPEFAVSVWDKAVGRGCKDAKEVTIRSFSHHLATEWRYEQARRFKDGKNGSGMTWHEKEHQEKIKPKILL